MNDEEKATILRDALQACHDAMDLFFTSGNTTGILALRKAHGMTKVVLEKIPPSPRTVKVTATVIDSAPVDR